MPFVSKGKPGPDNSPELLTERLGIGGVKGLARKVPALVNPKQVHSLLRDKVMLSPVPARNKCVDHSALTDALKKRPEGVATLPLPFYSVRTHKSHYP